MYDTDIISREKAKAIDIDRYISTLHEDAGFGDTSKKGRCRKKKKTTARNDALIQRINITDGKDIKREIAFLKRERPSKQFLAFHMKKKGYS